MIPLLISNKNPLSPINPGFRKPNFCCSQLWNPSKNKIHFPIPVIIDPNEDTHPISDKSDKNLIFGRKERSLLRIGNQDMIFLCGLGYYVNGFRGFPWLALNFHMAHNMNMHPSTLQLVQNYGNLPMVAKPLYGIISDALYIGAAHRIPYISIGVLLQILSWGSLALVPLASEACPILMACVLLSNLGASIVEVVKDALVTEYGHKNKVTGLQSYAFMASAIGGVLGNLLGGIWLLKTRRTNSMFLAFSALLSLQLIVSLKMREQSLGLSGPSDYTIVTKSIADVFKKQFSDLTITIRDGSVSRPLIWVVSSILTVPMLSGSLFCYQTRFLNLDPSIIGMSKVTGQLMLLLSALFYDRFGKNVPMRKLASFTQILYALSLLLDLVLVKQLNVRLGISNEVFTLCFSGLAETIAQFKLLPIYVLFASLAPSGCEGSLMSFLASALCLSSIFSGLLGVGLASFLGITCGDYSSLHWGILIQFVAALLPLGWIHYMPMSRVSIEKARKRGRSKRTRRNRRVGHVLFDSAHSYRRERESDLQR